MNQSSEAATDPQDDQLNRAIQELRGVLHDDGKSGTQQAPIASAPSGAAHNASVILDIPVEVQIVLGNAEMPVSDLMALQKGSTIALNRRIGEPVDIVVNGRKIARGEITVLDNDPSRFGVRLTEIVTATKPA